MGNKNFCECFEDAVIASIDKFGMIKKDGRLLIAFSGGVDSAVLLYVLYRLADRYGIQLGAFHLNHGIRGFEADRDEAHCKKVCLDLGVLYYNRLGAEGESGRSEGGIRRDFGSLNQDLPRSLLTELNRYTRVISVIEE